MKNLLKKIQSGLTKVWRWSSGKKRLIAIGCGLVKMIIPAHTVVGQSASWLQNNLDYVNIGLEVSAGLFGGLALAEHGAKNLKKKYGADKLPSLITKVMDKIPDSLTGIKGASNESASGSKN